MTTQRSVGAALPSDVASLRHRPDLDVLAGDEFGKNAAREGKQGGKGYEHGNSEATA